MANFTTDEGLTFDDVLLVPQVSPFKSRQEVDTSTRLGNRLLKVPIVSANMDSITGPAMAFKMFAAGTMGILHRYAPWEERLLWGRDPNEYTFPAYHSVGVKEGELDAAKAFLDVGAAGICVDIAHGHSHHAFDMVEAIAEYMFKNDLNATLIAGNVATREGALYLYRAGAHVIKVGIGPGSMCKTRLVTGHGVPQLSAIIAAAKAKREIGDDFQIIADGGIRNSGDIVKALAAGADAVMVGRLFAGTREAALPNEYRGMASREAQEAFLGKVSNGAPEGVAINLGGEMSRRVIDVLEELVGGIRSGLSYSGCKNIKELQAEHLFMKVSANTVVENGPHGKR